MLCASVTWLGHKYLVGLAGDSNFVRPWLLRAALATCPTGRSLVTRLPGRNNLNGEVLGYAIARTSEWTFRCLFLIPIWSNFCRFFRESMLMTSGICGRTFRCLISQHILPESGCQSTPSSRYGNFQLQRTNSSLDLKSASCFKRNFSNPTPSWTLDKRDAMM